MVTTLPDVRVVTTEDHKFLVTCNRCQLHTIRDSRPEADQVATGHRGAHNTPESEDWL